jgi:hypothetical protein
MRLHPSRFERLQEFIWGSNYLTPMLTYQPLMRLINSIGIEDVYDFENGRLPSLSTDTLNVSRRTYVLRKLNEINGSDRMKDLLERIFSHDHFLIDPSKNLDQAVEQVNQLIQTDHYELQLIDGQYRVMTI